MATSEQAAKRVSLAGLNLRLQSLERRAASGRRLAARYRNDPVAFASDCIRFADGEGLTDYQKEVLRNLVTYRREAVRGPHGLGKTTLAALAVLWFALSRDGEDWKVLTTASSWRQLTVYLWPEIHKWAQRLKLAPLGRGPLRPGEELLQLSLKLTTGQASAVASDRAELLEGAHAAQVLYVLDEAKAIPTATFDSIEGAFASGDCYALAISTPGDVSGRFYEINSRQQGTEDWHVSHVSLTQAIAAGRVSAAWAKQRLSQWGEASAVYQNRVLGEFASTSADSVIPLAWVAVANDRFMASSASGGVSAFTCVGVDVARSGRDRTVLALRRGNEISELRSYAGADTMTTTGLVAGLLQANPGGYAVVDVIGIGAGVVDRLREQGYAVIAFNASAATSQRDRSGELGFVNQRSAAWWALRELLDPANGAVLGLPVSDELSGDLTAPRWTVTSSGRIAIESKDTIRARLGRSTDHGDAVIQAFYAPQYEHLWLTYEEPDELISPF